MIAYIDRKLWILLRRYLIIYCDSVIVLNVLLIDIYDRTNANPHKIMLF